ncbi:peptide chain release factor N(5)-glutamine methyltransferase [Acetobacter sacchari]|uniref:Release factor glutamine methyltransferase n=1 Tax=Acetobacter sacchari TaxID=2661687 RepID=A0ABS3LU94_9PROT|nr:peptide chain release factor N(5)-glutamine methyltransferase [Acetobacter sacchari]MBO1359474.1 peptide chain release factor N(5)-glutamine methyltransferase [Acetobacter sacchari]
MTGEAVDVTAGGDAARTVGEWINLAADILRQADVDDPRREARLLFELTTGIAPLEQIAQGRSVLADVGGFMSLVRRREKKEPMAHLSGRKGFWTLDLEVTPETLIPRGDSETLVEAVLDARPDRSAVTKVLDLGCGTGCLLLAVLSEYPEAFGVGLDRVPAAAALARRNASRNALGDRATFVAGSWTHALRGQFDVVLSNPPYIPTPDLNALMPDVRRYEPFSALDGGADGLDDYRCIIPALTEVLAPDGLAVLEIGVGQEESVPAIAVGEGLVVFDVRRDLAGMPRAVILGRNDRSG